jgi:transposase-like protein
MTKRDSGAGIGKQASGNNSVLESFRSQVKAMALQVLMRGMEVCVSEVCGQAHERGNKSMGRRAGNEKSRVLVFDEYQEVERPRMRNRTSTGKKGQEIENGFYESVKGRGLSEQELFKMMQNGVSTRGLDRLEKAGSSAYYGKKAWAEGTARALEEFRNRDLGSYRFFALMVDGVVLSKGVVIVVAMGITTSGEKILLDFEQGNSESLETCNLLMRRLISRRFKPGTQVLLAILDGADALSKSIKNAFGAERVLIQRCLVHKERNLHSYLSYRDRGECSRLMNLIRKAEGIIDGEKAYKKLELFLKGKNDGALKSLHEGKEELLTVHRLNCSQLLHPTLLSTNLIENAFRNYRRHTDRVTRWNEKSDQASRWTASALLWVEKGFRRIRGLEKLEGLIESLGGLCPRAASDYVSGEAIPSGSSTPFTPSKAGDQRMP